MNFWIVFFVVLVTVRLVIGDYFYEPPQCVDGWRSPSIGTQGACSHHGGVKPPPRTAILISAALAALAATLVAVYGHQGRNPFRKAENADKLAVKADEVAHGFHIDAHPDWKSPTPNEAELKVIIAANRAREEASARYLEAERNKREKREIEKARKKGRT